MYRNLFVFIVLNVFYSYIDTTVEVVPCEAPVSFWCANKKCVPVSFRCDGTDDCKDNSDELNCDNFTMSNEMIRCAEDEFQCSDRSCIPKEKFCDAKSDCPDKSDEYDGCVSDVKCDTFRCNDGYCIKNEWVCDGTPDCPDKSDENSCQNKIIPIEECNNEQDRYLCKNQRCIYLNATCNEKDDCGDNSDENIIECKKADESCKQTAKCEHNCRRTPEGAKCSCRSGYKLMDNQTCADVDECENYGVCDQKCINNVGSYTCSCQPRYTLNDDQKTCTAEGGEAWMVFSTKSKIYLYYLTSKRNHTVTENLQHAVAVSLNVDYVYWSDIKDGEEVISRSLDDGLEREIIATTGLSNPDNIAVDWVTGNIYFTDSGYMHIGVCNDNGSYCTVIIKERNNEPTGLALLPSSGMMYWSEWSANSCILMAGMDGRNSTVLINQNLKWPSSLTIDYANDRLYWVDGKQKLIESVRLDGRDRRIILNGIAKKPFSLAVFENKLYWSDWISNSIQSCDKFTGKDWNILLKLNSTIYGIHIYHSVLKPEMPNPCKSEPCSQLCLLNPENKYTCACTMDQELNSDGHTCRAIKKRTHLVIAAGNTFIDYYHELLGKPKMTTSNILKQVTHVAYDPLTGGLLASDQLTESIFHYNTHTAEYKDILHIRNKILGGMDFDYIGNNLYISDVIHKTIEVHSLNTHENTVFYFQDEPYDIALVPEEGVMMVVFLVNGRYRIDMMNMNGLSPRITIEGNKIPLLGPKVSLFYDRDLQRLFWSDQGTGRIGSTTIPGYETYIFRTGLSEPVSLAIIDDHVFWTQYKSNQLYWTSKSGSQQYQKRITLQVPHDLHIDDRMQLVSLRRTYVNENECRKNNGNCSHVCLLSNPHTHICACPPDMMLTVDNRTCSTQTACKPGEVKCGEHDICITLEQRCNGVIDCPNGEDESSSCNQIEWSNCKQDEFQCKNGECISKKKRCNSHYDCVDRSDEEDCDKKECDSNEFQCQEGACISKYLVCNGKDDCTDFSDEINCGKYTCDNHSFACEKGGCIPITWKCDGDVDCSDGSDENEMCQRNPCPSEMFTCSNGRCIDMRLKCNGNDECEDNSDEMYCTDKSSNNYVNCTANEYKCYYTEMCLPKRVRCNGVQDCPKNDDERNCAQCQDHEYPCDNQKCIEKRWVCDGVNDCGDGSDEKNCDGANPELPTISTISNCKEFQCSNGVCLPFSKVCDGKVDCFDRSDESGECSIACTKNNPCANICHKTPVGPVCGCRSGYQLSSNLKSCEDIDECKNDVCSQICHNTDGSFTCSCHEGYVIRSDRTSCKVAGPQMEIIAISGSDIRKLSPSLNSIEVIYEEVNSEISGIDVNAREEIVYWSNDILGMVSKIHMKSKKRSTVTGLGRPEALAVDWITDNVYFNDNDHFSTIKVCNLEQQKCAKLVSIGSRDKATAITVEPKQGLLFWSQTTWRVYDTPTTEIYRSTTIGTNSSAIVQRNLGVVFALTIDYTRSRLYWTDTFHKRIESSNFDGSNRALFLDTKIYQPLSISIYEDYLYWLRGTTGIVKKCKLYGDKSCVTIPVGHLNIDKYFTILHSTRQPIIKNTCENYKCDYMCVLENNSPACVCHNGYLKNSNDSCAKDTNTNFKFNSNIVSHKNKDTRQSGTLVGVIITIVTCIVIASAYFYYQKVKPNFSKKNNLSIHFQNPSYNRRNEITASLNCISGLPPGEHEYVNPITDIEKNQNENITGKNEKQLMKILNLDQSDDEPEDSHKRDINLI